MKGLVLVINGVLGKEELKKRFEEEIDVVLQVVNLLVPLVKRSTNFRRRDLSITKGVFTVRRRSKGRRTF